MPGAGDEKGRTAAKHAGTARTFAANASGERVRTARLAACFLPGVHVDFANKCFLIAICRGESMKVRIRALGENGPS